MRVGIVGMGVIGTAQAEMFKDHDLVTYDPLDDNVYPRHMMSKADLILVCVGTPERPDGRADLQYVAQAVNELPGGVPVAIRSTVPPGTTDRLLSNRLYAHAPEFMGENVLHSWQKPADVPYMIIGGESVATLFFRQKFAQVFPGTIHTCSAREVGAGEVRGEPVLGDAGNVRQRVRPDLRAVRRGLREGPGGVA